MALDGARIVLFSIEHIIAPVRSAEVERSWSQVMPSILPFCCALGLCLLLVTYEPAFSLWLPNLYT